MYLFIDNETTGLPRKGGHIQPGQARVCQIAAILCDSKGNAHAELASLIQPDGWAISEGARNVHGITDEDCASHGLPLALIIECLNQMMARANVIVCHNYLFDSGMLDIEYAYHGTPRPRLASYCTMVACKGQGHAKTNLTDMLRHYCQREHGDAHDAMADARACKDIFFALKERGLTRIAA